MMNLQTQHRRKGDTQTPIAARLERPDGRQIDLTGETVKFKMLSPDGTTKVALTSDNVTVHPTKTFTADATTDRLTSAEHKLESGIAVFVSSTTTLPGGLAASTWYWVVNAEEHTFQLATRPGGTPIDISSAGTGTHSFTIVGSVQYAPQADDVDTKGAHPAYFVRDSSSSLDTFPVERRTFIVDIDED